MESSDGVHIFAIQAKDAANNSAPLFTPEFQVGHPVAVHHAFGSILNNATIDASTLLTGAANPTGSQLTVLNYKFDSGTPRSISFDPVTGSFNEPGVLGNLSVGNHTLTLTRHRTQPATRSA